MVAEGLLNAGWMFTYYISLLAEYQKNAGGMLVDYWQVIDLGGPILATCWLVIILYCLNTKWR